MKEFLHYSKEIVMQLERSLYMARRICKVNKNAQGLELTLEADLFESSEYRYFDQDINFLRKANDKNIEMKMFIQCVNDRCFRISYGQIDCVVKTPMVE